jgi:hypothetical protein
MMFAMLLESQDSKITQAEGQAKGLGEHTLIPTKTHAFSLCAYNQQMGNNILLIDGVVVIASMRRSEQFVYDPVVPDVVVVRELDCPSIPQYRALSCWHLAGKPPLSLHHYFDFWILSAVSTDSLIMRVAQRSDYKSIGRFFHWACCVRHHFLSVQAEEGWRLLDVVVFQCPSVLERCALKAKALSVGWDAFLVRDHAFDFVDSV